MLGCDGHKLDVWVSGGVFVDVWFLLLPDLFGRIYSTEFPSVASGVLLCLINRVPSCPHAVCSLIEEVST